MQRIFQRQLKELEKVFEFVQESLTEYRIDPTLIFSANFIVEELFTNMVKYNRTTSDILTISLEKKNNSLIISLMDDDVDSFDPRATRDIDISKPAEERSIGGLGIYLVKKMVDKIDYEYTDRKSKITVTLALEKRNV